MAKGGRPATAPKRLLLSLPADLYALISEVAKRVGSSRAGVVRELVEEARPGLEMLKEAVDKIAGGKKGEAVSLIRALVGKIHAQLDEEMKPLDEKPLTREQLLGKARSKRASPKQK